MVRPIGGMPPSPGEKPSGVTPQKVKQTVQQIIKDVNDGILHGMKYVGIESLIAANTGIEVYFELGNKTNEDYKTYLSSIEIYSPDGKTKLGTLGKISSSALNLMKVKH